MQSTAKFASYNHAHVSLAEKLHMLKVVLPAQCIIWREVCSSTGNGNNYLETVIEPVGLMQMISNYVCNYKAFRSHPETASYILDQIQTL